MKEKRASDRPLFLPFYSIADLIYNIVVFRRGVPEEWHSLIISGRAGRNLPSQNTSGSEQMLFCSEIT